MGRIRYIFRSNRATDRSTFLYTPQTVSVLLTFMLAMTLYPEVQNRAQEELDRVIGKDNLPTFEDRDNLPYVNAICTEALRYASILCGQRINKRSLNSGGRWSCPWVR